jgi:cytochrome c
LDSFEFNKIAGWLLAAFVALLGISIGTSMAFRPEKPVKQSYVVEGVEADAGAEAVAPVEAEKPIGAYMAAATMDKGEATFKKCAACHNAEKGGAAGIGPNLYGIVGGVHAHMEGFAYSDALTAMKGKPWTWDELNKWLTNPKAYAPGTKMAFAGIAKPEERASILMYLNSKSDKPLPMPEVPAEAAADAPAADAAKPAA